MTVSTGAPAAIQNIIDVDAIMMPQMIGIQNLLRTFAEANSFVHLDAIASINRSIAPIIEGLNFQKMIGIPPIVDAVESMRLHAIDFAGFDSLAKIMSPLSNHIAALNLPVQHQMSDAISQMISASMKLDFGAATAMAQYGRLAESSPEFADAAADMRASLVEIQGVPAVVETLTARAFKRMRGSTVTWAQLEWGAFVVVSMLIMTITIYGAQSPEVHAIFSMTGYNNLAGALTGGFGAKVAVRRLAIKKGDPRHR
ncbi:hypothetical protein [Specibacter sp. NPDC078692]|uniref:hypothetical protein n=1 Tax=Specibacter sp. NPDC078692 TaxID=3155818 RepID=UPI0034188CC0